MSSKRGRKNTRTRRFRNQGALDEVVIPGLIDVLPNPWDTVRGGMPNGGNPYSGTVTTPGDYGLRDPMNSFPAARGNTLIAADSGTGAHGTGNPSSARPNFALPGTRTRGGVGNGQHITRVPYRLDDPRDNPVVHQPNLGFPGQGPGSRADRLINVIDNSEDSRIRAAKSARKAEKAVKKAEKKLRRVDKVKVDKIPMKLIKDETKLEVQRELKKALKAPKKWDSPSVVAGKMAALAMAFPSMLPPQKGVMGPYADVLGNAPTAPVGSKYRTSLTFIQGGTTTTKAFALFYITPSSKGHYNAYSTLTGDAFTTQAATDDPIQSTLTTMAYQEVMSGCCLRVMSANAMTSSAATVLIGNLPFAAVGTGTVTFASLQALPATQEITLPAAQDFCMAWEPKSNIDGSVNAVATALTTNTTVLFVAVSTPYVSSAPLAGNIDIEVYTNYTVSPLLSYQGILATDENPVDVPAYQDAFRAINGNNPLGQPATMTIDVKNMFSKAVEVLGPSVKKALGSVNWGDKIRKVGGWISGLFGTKGQHIDQVLRTLQGRKNMLLQELDEVDHKLPKELVLLLRSLGRFDIHIEQDDLYIRDNVLRTVWSRKANKADPTNPFSDATYSGYVYQVKELDAVDDDDRIARLEHELRMLATVSDDDYEKVRVRAREDEKKVRLRSAITEEKK